MKSPIETLQPLGRALMLPIAVLPIAGLLLRIGQPDLLDIAFLSAAGSAIFNHLGLLFAIGVAAGFARDGNGAACLAGVTCFLIATEGAAVLLVVPSDAVAGQGEAAAAVAATAWRAAQIDKLAVPIGIVSGLVGGNFYNRFATIALPEYLAFFGGRRFVPIASGLVGLLLAAMVGLGYGQISAGINAGSRAIVGAGGAGLFVFGVLNRLLIVTGLHHILNNVAWFIIGEYHGATGDLRRFFAGDPIAGAFMSGFFPVMMFGLPAACLAMFHEARPEQRKAVSGLLFSLGLTSFLTGVTEPIEFSFMFLAPLLYAIHAVLTGLAMMVMNALGVRLGFGFSAGLFDYVLNFGLATRPLLLLPIGGAYALAYYGLFRVAIRRFDLKTPGRTEDAVVAPAGAQPDMATGRAGAFVAALGGTVNLSKVEACTTRLRLIVEDQAQVDEPALRALGARGLLRPSAHALQVVLGPLADLIAAEMRDAMDDAGRGAVQQPELPMAPADRAELPAALRQALGGDDNVVAARTLHGRLRVEIGDPAEVDWARLGELSPRGVAQVGPNVIHLLVAP